MANRKRSSDKTSTATSKINPPKSATKPVVEEVLDTELPTEEQDDEMLTKGFDEDDDELPESTPPVALTQTGSPAAATATSSATTAKKSTYEGSYQQKMRKLGPVAARAILAKRTAVRVERLAASFDGWSFEGPAGDLFETARKVLTEARNALLATAIVFESVPATWRPTAGATHKAPAKDLETGAVIDIRESARAKFYKGLVADADMTELTVITVANGKVKARTKGSKETILLPRGHVSLHAVAAE